MIQNRKTKILQENIILEDFTFAVGDFKR